MEHALLVVFVSTSAYMFVASYEFAYAAGLFPRFTTGVVIVLGVMLLFRNYLPGPLRRFATESVEVLDTEQDTVETAETTDEREATVESVERGPLATGGLCVLYLLASYLIGMLWATPLFVATYSLWTRQSWYGVVGLTVLSFVIAYAFYSVLNLRIVSGVLL